MVMPENKNIDDINIYDCVLIGAGPVNIIEAAYRIQQGEKVVIIEERDKPAGAWSTIQYDQMPEIEIGCHIWDVDENTYRFLEQLLGLDLVRLSPQPRIRKYGVRWPYDWKMNAITAKRFIKLAFSLKFGQIRKDIGTPANRVGVLPKKYLYPKHGAFEVKKGIENLINNYNIPIVYNSCANAMDIDETTQLVTQGKTYTTQKVILSSLSHFDKITVFNKAFTANYTRLKYVHVHLLIDSKLNKNLSYDRVMGHPLIHRISDMSSQVKHELKDGQSLVCVGVFQKAFENQDTTNLGATVLNELKELNYIPSSSQLINWGHNVFEAAYSKISEMEHLVELSNGKIGMLRSSNFIFGIHAQLDRWSTLLK